MNSNPVQEPTGRDSPIYVCFACGNEYREARQKCWMCGSTSIRPFPRQFIQALDAGTKAGGAPKIVLPRTYSRWIKGPNPYVYEGGGLELEDQHSKPAITGETVFHIFLGVIFIPILFLALAFAALVALLAVCAAVMPPQNFQFNH
jgi:hypothetical protein